jgi:hypothetical protein
MLQQPSHSSNHESDLKEALTALEVSVLTPIVPGELPTWAEQVQATWTEASAQIHHHVKQLHPRQYEEIAEQDPELLPRIELLKVEDQAIALECEEFNKLIGRVTRYTPEVEPDEGKASRDIQSLVDGATQFISRVRKQSIGVQTWFSEAFARDRGAVD